LKKNFELLEAHYKSRIPPKLERQNVKNRQLKLQMPKIRHPKALPVRSKEAASTVITVSTPFGLKSFTLGRIKKRVLVSFTAFTVLFLVFGSVGLFFSLSNNFMLAGLLDKTKQRYQDIIAENRGLKSIVDAEKALKEKEANVENLISLRSDSVSTQKLELSSVSVEQKTMLLKNIPNGSPVPFEGVTSDFGSRNHPVLGRSIFHEGIDLKAGIGTKVYSAADGIIEETKYNGGYGNMLVVTHAYGFKSVYGHLSRFAARPGEFVKKGQLVAFSGNTGMTAGPHLHYEVRFMGAPMNPAPFIKWNYTNFAYLFERENKIRWASLVEATKWQTQAERLSSLPAQKSSAN
jgi:murein DD-endopeptidase MepM/ murein hydrolase activator NlpD